MDRGMTEYGQQRLRDGEKVTFGSEEESLGMHIEANGDVILEHPYGTFRIPRKLRRTIAEGLLVEREPTHG